MWIILHFTCRYVQFLFAAEITRCSNDCRVHWKGNGALTEWQVPLLPSSSGSRSSSSTSPALIPGVTHAQHALSSAHLPISDCEDRTTGSHRSSAHTTAAQGVPQTDSVLRRGWCYQRASVLQSGLVMIRNLCAASQAEHKLFCQACFLVRMTEHHYFCPSFCYRASSLAW